MEVIVSIFSEKVGTLYEDSGVISFEYDQAFLNGGLNLSPIKLPFNVETYSNKDDKYFGTLAGVFFDSLPDKFGTKIMERYYESRGKAARDLTLLQKLVYIGNRGMGALEYEPREEFLDNADVIEPIEIREIYESTKKIIKGDTSQSVKEILALMTSSIQAGGARPKSTIGWNREKNIMTNSRDSDYEQWLVKFDSEDSDSMATDFTKLEYLYMSMAKDCGINIPAIDMISDNNLKHFAIKRFDRNGANKIHMHSLASLVHVDFNEPLHYSYDEAIRVVRYITKDVKDIEEFYRRAIFNIVAVNQDDHAKNTSFLMNAHGEWSLSPAYDITYANGKYYTKNHQMSIIGKVKDFRLNELIGFGVSSGVKKIKATEIIENTIGIVASFQQRAKDLEIREDLINLVKSDLEDRTNGLIGTSADNK